MFYIFSIHTKKKNYVIIAISFYGNMFLSQYGSWKLHMCREPKKIDEKNGYLIAAFL